MQNDAQELLDKRGAARVLGVSPLSMNRLMIEIGFVRVGKRRVMFTREAIDAYIRRRTVPPKIEKR
jgi:hypothetical protein